MAGREAGVHQPQDNPNVGEGSQRPADPRPLLTREVGVGCVGQLVIEDSVRVLVPFLVQVVLPHGLSCGQGGRVDGQTDR